MVSFVWTPSLAVGFDEMDEQHQQLIALMGLLHRKGAEGVPKQDFLDTCDELAQLTVRHFAEEEKIMMTFEYPRLDVHQGQHASLLDRLEGYRKALGRPSGKLTEEFTTFLGYWLTGHIKGPDTQYGVYSGALTRRV